jgi:hypothetical protein
MRSSIARSTTGGFRERHVSASRSGRMPQDAAAHKSCDDAGGVRDAV